MITSAEIRQALSDGYVSCTECGQPLHEHDETGYGAGDGFACPIKLTDAERAGILADYGFNPDGLPRVHFVWKGGRDAACGAQLDSEERTSDYTQVTCPACLATGETQACSACYRPVEDPAHHCAACGECGCTDLECQTGGELDGDDYR